MIELPSQRLHIKCPLRLPHWFQIRDLLHDFTAQRPERRDRAADCRSFSRCYNTRVTHGVGSEQAGVTWSTSVCFCLHFFFLQGSQSSADSVNSEILYKKQHIETKHCSIQSLVAYCSLYFCTMSQNGIVRDILRSHGVEYEFSCLQGCCVTQSGRNRLAFQRALQ